jgi:hypothetical protein
LIPFILADELGDTDDDFITASDMLRKSKGKKKYFRFVPFSHLTTTFRFTDENKMVEADMKKLDDSWVETLRG